MGNKAKRHRPRERERLRAAGESESPPTVGGNAKTRRRRAQRKAATKKKTKTNRSSPVFLSRLLLDEDEFNQDLRLLGRYWLTVDRSAARIFLARAMRIVRAEPAGGKKEQQFCRFMLRIIRAEQKQRQEIATDLELLLLLTLVGEYGKLAEEAARAAGEERAARVAGGETQVAIPSTGG